MKIYNNVSVSQFSIARHYGGLTIQGESYKYDYANDALIRDKDIKQYCIEIKKVNGAKEPKWN